MKIFGQVLLWAGFLVGSLATVFNADSKGIKYLKSLTDDGAEKGRYELPDLSGVVVPEDGWHLIPWTWYIPAAVVCIAGIVMIRLGSSAQSQKSEKSEASLAEIRERIANVIESVSRLSKETDTLAPSKIAKRIDDDIADDLRVFADGRDSITLEYGLNVFADVMTQFAAGERAINRAWSASADGYVDEAATCLHRGEQLMRAAQEILENAPQVPSSS